jgi:Ca-activated chloride channel homolog
MKEASQNHRPNPELEARIVSLLLGEASELEHAQLQQLFEKQPELLVFKAKMESVHELMREVAMGDFPASHENWQLPAEKRHALLAVINPEAKHQPAKTPVVRLSSKSAPFNEFNLWSFAKIAAAFCVAGFFGLFVISSFGGRAKKMARSHLPLAATVEALENQTKSSAKATMSDFSGRSRIEDNREYFQAERQSTVEPALDHDSSLALLAIRDSLGNEKIPATSQFGNSETRTAQLPQGPAQRFSREPTLPPTPKTSEGKAEAVISQLTVPDPVALEASISKSPEADLRYLRRGEAEQSNSWGSLGRENSVMVPSPTGNVSEPNGTAREQVQLGDASGGRGVDAQQHSAFDSIEGQQGGSSGEAKNGAGSLAWNGAGSKSLADMPKSGAVPGKESGDQPARLELILSAPLETMSRAGTAISGKGKKAESTSIDNPLATNTPLSSTLNPGSPPVPRESESQKHLQRLDEAEAILKADDGVVSEGLAPKNIDGLAYYSSNGIVTMGGRTAANTFAPYKRFVVPEGLHELIAANNAFSTFSLHVSDVSFKLARAALAKGEWPEAAKIRIEEFVNAIDYGDPLPKHGEKVACRVEQSIHPFLQQRNLLRVSLRTSAAGRASKTPLRLTLLLDNSGSMERFDRQQTVRRAFGTLASQLQPIDQVTLISFARQPRLLADKISGTQSNQLVQLAENLPSEGGTNIEAALQLAFEKAKEQQTEDAQNRIVLLTDGAVNLGDANPESLSRMVTTMRDAGIAFDAAGISADGLNDEVLEALTRKGDGRYYLLDSAEAADDGFARQIAGALRPSSKNVKVQIEFNPKRVGYYKLLGYEKHLLKQEDFRNDQIDAAEMAAAEAGVAVYQFEAKADGEGDVGSVSVRFQDLTTGEMVENCWPIRYEPNAARPEQATPSMRIASCAALFAAKLRGDPLGGTVDLKSLSELLSSLPPQNRNGKSVQQLQSMIEQARQVSGK